LLDSRSDIFSLGRVLFEMVTGKRMADTMSAILNSNPATESPAAAEIPPALARVIRLCLEKDAGSGFQSAKDLAFELEAIAGNSRIALSTAKPSIKPRKFLLAAGAVALVVVGALGWPLLRPAPAEISFRRLTFHRGFVQAARFAPDGHTVIYGASWSGKSSRTRMVTPSLRATARDSRKHGQHGAIGPSEVQLADFLAGQNYRGSNLGVGLADRRPFLRSLVRFVRYWSSAAALLKALRRGGNVL
jgi:serine/threonine protein kinase